MTPWYSMTIPDCSSENEFTCKALVKNDSPWFSGHFPGDPILPGIAQLAIVFDAINQIHKGKKKISEIQRVRFKQVIRPDDPMQLTIKSCSKGIEHYLFKIMVRGDIACSGKMIVERSSKTV